MICENERRMSPPKIYLGYDSLSNFEHAIRLEWITTNGLGGYASSTVLGINTRKYHGLLFAAFNPPVNRHLLLAKIDEEVRVGDESYPLGSNEFKGTVYPDGYKRLVSFTLDPFPTFRYRVSGVYLTKRLFMPYLRKAVVLYYEVYNSLDETVDLRIYPIVNSRHFYEVTDQTLRRLKFFQQPLRDGVLISAEPGQSVLIVSSTADSYSTEEGIWIERVYLRVDDSRGESCLDDYYKTGFFTAQIPSKKKRNFYIIASGGKTEEEAETLYSSMRNEGAIKKLYVDEMNRKKGLLTRFISRNPRVKVEDWLKWLVLSADMFIVFRRLTGKKSVIAGYHWFGDWGRDSLISLPGLTLVTGRFEDAKEILLTFKQYCERGLLPNMFPERIGDKPAYNSVDASLWFCNAVLQYLKYTGDFDFVRRDLWDTLRAIIDNYIRGTLFNIRLDEDGLLVHGPQLTWMDVSIDGEPVTPRGGKAVEVQALWYNALKVAELLARRFNLKDKAQKYSSIAERARKNFNKKFWNPKKDYLFDVIDQNHRDPSLRPNQIIAASLDFCMLDNSKIAKIVNTVWKKFWAVYGLRTLSDDDPRYIGRYAGGWVQRERAYHNGTVWAWLIGPFVTAFLKVKRHARWWRHLAFENFLKPLFFEETFRAGIGTVSEIFDGDPPHTPRGCISQAWSVSEPLRAFVEDVLMKRPPFERQV